MAIGKMSHDWDLFAPLICCVANPNLPKRKRLTVKDIHPFYEQNKIVKPFCRDDWISLKQKLKRQKGHEELIT
jgi:hypothetical protein